MDFINPATMRVGDLYFIVALQFSNDQSLASIVRLGVIVTSKQDSADRIQVKVVFRAKGNVKEHPAFEYEYLIDVSKKAKMIGMDEVAVFNTGAKAASFNRHVSDVMWAFNVESLPRSEAIRLLKVPFFRNFNSGV
jgi:hypothetical protein